MNDNLKISDEERKLIEENLEVVKIVILTNFRYNNNVVGLSFEDLYQVGCLALCESVKKYNYSTKFSTFAFIVVKSKLLTYCKKINENNKRTSYIVYDDVVDKTEITSRIYEYEILKKLSVIKSNSRGVTLKGIIALELKVKGFTGREIADMYGVSTNNVSAWIARAKSKLGNEIFLDEIYYKKTV